MAIRKMTMAEESSLFYELKSRIQATETDVKYIHRDIKEIRENHLAHIQDTLTEMTDKLDQRFVTQDQFNPVRNIVFGAVGIILVAVLSALVYMVVR